MYKTKYRCEVITPMFLRGEDGKKLELRAPTIKGALRFWWRALHGYLKENELREKEKFLFGGIGEDSRKSAFSIKTKLVKDIPKENVSGVISPLPHKQRSFLTEAFLVGTKFEVEFIVKSFVYYEKNKQENKEIIKKDGKEIIDEIENLFELMSILGGLGMRARRGFGAFRIIKKENQSGKHSNFDFCDIDSIKRKIDLYAENKYIVKSFDMGEMGNVDMIEVINKNKRNLIDTSIKQISLGWPPYENADKLTYHLGKLSHDAREIDYYPDDIKKSNITKQNIENALGKAKGGRFASPIYVSAIKYGEELLTVITKLNSKKVSNIEEKIQDEFIIELWW